MTNYMELPVGPQVPKIVNAVIEIPKGSSNKYEYDHHLHVFKLDRTLYSPVHYPGAYGFIPSTLAEDGDPLDVLVIIEHPTFTGCLMEVRPVGVLIMEDDQGLDHKVLGVPVQDPRMRDVKQLRHLPSHYLAEVDYFFNIYKDLEGKHTDTYGWEDADKAEEVIQDCIEREELFRMGKVNRWGKAIG
ncbi:MAG: inorganic diphosphatase [Planctomycetes bacterium]|nr:inorganic diphosphatase [Planctomycetota bacterium]